jgi:hypothetical protein
MPKYKVGDTVWVPQAGNTQVEIPCPVCFGKKVITLILGNDDHVILDCDYCNKGSECPRGFVTEYQFVATAYPVTIDAVCVETRQDKEIVEYKVIHSEFSSSSYKESNLFTTKEEAEVAAKVMADKQIADESERESNRKKNVTKSFTWNAGYWTREAKKHREEAERCDKRAQVQSERARKRKEANKE